MNAINQLKTEKENFENGGHEFPEQELKPNVEITCVYCGGHFWHDGEGVESFFLEEVCPDKPSVPTRTKPRCNKSWKYTMKYDDGTVIDYKITEEWRDSIRYPESINNHSIRVFTTHGKDDRGRLAIDRCTDDNTYIVYNAFVKYPDDPTREYDITGREILKLENLSWGDAIKQAIVKFFDMINEELL